MKKLKILILANDTTYVYNLRDEIIKRLVADGHEVVVVANILLFEEELKAIGCRLVNVETNRHGTNPFADLGLLSRYKKILRAEKPDIVYTYNIKPNAYGGIACRRTKTRYFSNITGLGKAVEYPGIVQKISIILYKIGVAGADCIFFQNEANREFFKTHKMLKKGCRERLLPGSGVNIQRHAAMEYPPDGEKINFLFVARIMKEKGIDIYLNAAKRIYENHKNVVFNICGYCDDENYLELLKEAEKIGYIVYHGEQKDLKPFFEAAHCVAHPSYYPEGMSNVLLEAAAHARPVIATDRAGCRETVDDGKTGFVVPVKDEDAFVDALEKIINMSWEERRDMGLAGRKKIEREFDRKLVVEAYIEETEKIFG